jgi:hypothetical protein
MKDILEKLKGVLNEADLKKLEATINEAIEIGVKAQTEELKKKYDLLSEEFCNKKIADGVKDATVKLEKEYTGKLVLLEEKLNKNLDAFIESEVIPQIDKNMITKLAINESMEPVVRGIKEVLETNGITINSDGKVLLTEARDEIVKLQKEVNGLMKDKQVLNEKVDSAAKFLMIADKTKGLKPEQTKRITTLFEGKDFSETKSKIDTFIKVVLNEELTPPTPKEKEEAKSKAVIVEKKVEEIKPVVNEEKKPVVTDDLVLQTESESALTEYLLND